MIESLSLIQTLQAEAALRAEVLQLRKRVAELEAGTVPAEFDSSELARTFQETPPILAQERKFRKQIEPVFPANQTYLPLFDQAPVGISLLRDGVLIFVNPAYARIFGYENPADLRGMSIRDLVAPGDREWVIELNRQREQGRPVSETAEKLGLRKDGTHVNVHVSGVKIDLPDGPASLVVITDITERKQAEQTLQETLDLNQKIITSAQAAILAYRRDGQCVLANKAAARIVNTTTQALLEQNIFQLESWKRSGLLEMAKETLASRQPAQGQIHTVTSYGREVWLDVRMTLFSSSGESHLLVMMEDITERCLVETALQESEERFRTSIEAILDGFAIFSAVRDASGKIVDFRYDYINEAGCRLNGRTSAEQVGHSMLELLPNHKDGLLDAYAGVVETGNPFCRETLVYEDVYGGETRLARAFDFQAVKLGDGFAVTWRDVTERKLNEQKLSYLSSHDSLTGLYNRSYFNQALQQLEQDDSSRATVLMIDVDLMKNTNDTLGHCAGDELLERTARVLRSVFREQDVVARIGGDEFAVILPDTKMSEAELVTRIQAAVERENKACEAVALRLSIGGAVAEESVSLRQALHIADEVMYTRKRITR